MSQSDLNKFVNHSENKNLSETVVPEFRPSGYVNIHQKDEMFCVPSSLDIFTDFYITCAKNHVITGFLLYCNDTILIEQQIYDDEWKEFNDYKTCKMIMPKIFITCLLPGWVAFKIKLNYGVSDHDVRNKDIKICARGGYLTSGVRRRLNKEVVVSNVNIKYNKKIFRKESLLQRIEISFRDEGFPFTKYEPIKYVAIESSVEPTEIVFTFSNCAEKFKGIDFYKYVYPMINDLPIRDNYYYVPIEVKECFCHMSLSFKDKAPKYVTIHYIYTNQLMYADGTAIMRYIN
jgi:hypothetical protein